MKVYQKLGYLMESVLNCRKNKERAEHETRVKYWDEWEYVHTKKLEDFIDDFLPHGSGFNYTLTYDFNDVKKIVFESSYDCMHEGMYDIVVPFKITVTSTLSGYDINCSLYGTRIPSRHYGLKDYILDTFANALDGECNAGY